MLISKNLCSLIDSNLKENDAEIIKHTPKSSFDRKKLFQKDLPKKPSTAYVPFLHQTKPLIDNETQVPLTK